jgi:phospholipid/cholesterol/gamma-HCH transport system substrate-binding protein
VARHTEGSILRLGAVSLVVLLVVMAAAFNLQKFPGFRGTGYHVDLSDASGLHAGNMVQIAGVRVGRVNKLHIHGDHITVDFDVKGAEMGNQTQASVQVLNLLGEKYLQIDPKGSGTMASGATIPKSRTYGGYDIVSTLSELTTRTEQTDIPQLSQALTTLGDTLNAASPNVKSTFTGLSRVSRSIATRDAGIQKLLDNAASLTKLLAQRRGDLVTLMKQGDLVFKELLVRRNDIHALLVNAQKLAVNLRGLATDNQGQVKDALKQLDTALTFLRGRKTQLDTALKNLGPYASILINIIGTGPWFDAFVPNLTSLGTGEFTPGDRPNYP